MRTPVIRRVTIDYLPQRDVDAVLVASVGPCDGLGVVGAVLADEGLGPGAAVDLEAHVLDLPKQGPRAAPFFPISRESTAVPGRDKRSDEPSARAATRTGRPACAVSTVRGEPPPDPRIPVPNPGPGQRDLVGLGPSSSRGVILAETTTIWTGRSSTRRC